MATESMIARAALGHSGDEVRNTPFLVRLALYLMALYLMALYLMVVAVLGRVVRPGVLRDYCFAWIDLAQAAWIGSYSAILEVLPPVFFPKGKWLREPRIVIASETARDSDAGI